MKVFILSALLATSLFASRQYIQCATQDSDERHVINLNDEQSTYMRTPGVHLPEPVFHLKDIELEQQLGNTMVFKTLDHQVQERIFINSEHINIASKHFEVLLETSDESRDLNEVQILGCFSSIYHD